jgi:hypothetical protein
MFFKRKIDKRVAKSYIIRKEKYQTKKHTPTKGKIHAAVHLLWGLTTPPLQLLLKEQPKVQLKGSKPKRVALGGNCLDLLE